MKFAIFYHDPCFDGMAAYTILSMALTGHDVIGIPCKHPMKINKGKPYDVSDRYVLMVDFAFPVEELNKLAQNCRGVIVMDHHKTNAEDLRQFHTFKATDLLSLLDQSETSPVVWFDNTKSGAQLALEFVKQVGLSTPSESVEKAVAYVADYDLWAKKMPHINEVIEAMTLLLPGYDLPSWTQFMNSFEDQFEKTVLLGDILLAQHRMRVAEFVDQAFTVELDGEVYPASDAPHYFRNDVGNILAEKFGKPAWVFSVTGPEVSVSVRSVGNDPEQDTTSITRRFGGGGHFNASGCRIPLQEFAKLIKSRNTGL